MTLGDLQLESARSIKGDMVDFRRIGNAVESRLLLVQGGSKNNPEDGSAVIGTTGYYRNMLFGLADAVDVPSCPGIQKLCTRSEGTGSISLQAIEQHSSSSDWSGSNDNIYDSIDDDSNIGHDVLDQFDASESSDGDEVQEITPVQHKSTVELNEKAIKKGSQSSVKPSQLSSKRPRKITEEGVQTRLQLQKKRTWKVVVEETDE